MTVNCKIWLEPTADFDDIVFVMRAAAGNKVTQEVLEFGTIYSVDGRLHISYHSFAPTMITVDFESPARPSSVDSHVNIHLNQTSGRHAGQTFLGPVSNPFWGAIGKRLVEVFGGEIVYDSDGTHTFKAPRKKFMGADVGKKWQKRQHALGAVKPITIEEMREAENYTAWKLSDSE